MKQRTTLTTPTTTRRLLIIAIAIGLVSPAIQLGSWHSFVVPYRSLMVVGLDEESEQAIIAPPSKRRNDDNSYDSQGAAEDDVTAVVSPTSHQQKEAEDVNVGIGGAFIHVGKTGGSTLTRYLRNACHSYIPKPCKGVIPPNETLVSKLITDYYHVPDFFRLPRQHHSFYLISLRDPLDRTISAFVNNHPNNTKILDPKGSYQLYWKRKRKGYFDAKCFETLEQFVANIGEGDPHQYVYENTLPIHMKRDNCTNFCRAVMHSKVKRLIHLFWSYEKLVSLLPTAAATTNNTTTTATTTGKNLEQIFDNLTIYATRKEHLLEDFQRINHHLMLDRYGRHNSQKGETNGNEDERPVAALANNNNNIHNNIATTKVRDVSNITLPIKRDLSPQGRERLCRALDVEYRIYIELLFQAKNLNRQDVLNSLQYSQKQCPNLPILSQEHIWNRMETSYISDSKFSTTTTTTTATKIRH